MVNTGGLTTFYEAKSAFFKVELVDIEFVWMETSLYIIGTK